MTDTKEESVPTRYLKNTIDEMLIEQGMDPDTTVVHDVSYDDGEIILDAEESGSELKHILIAKAVTALATKPTIAHEVSHGEYSVCASIMNEEITIEIQGPHRESTMEISKEMGKIIAASQYQSG